MLITLVRRLGSKGNSKSSRTPLRRQVRLGLECLEARELPSVAPMVFGPNDNNVPALHSSTDPTQVGGGGAAQNGTTPSAAHLPVAPTMTATAVSSSQINLAWNKVSGATSYVIDEWVNGAWTTIATFGKTTIGCKVTGLAASTNYSFDVGAENSVGASWATYKSATTLAASITINEPTAAVAYSPVTGTLFGANGPSYLDVEQGDVGDCWLLSSLAEVAARDPSDITSMFTSEGTTTENGATVSVYSVRFFDNGVAKNVTVSTELPGGGDYYDHPANGVLWVALAEKAYAEANGYGYVTTQQVGSNSYNALDGGDPTWALAAITGKSATDYSINPTNIASAWNSGELVVLCTTTPNSIYIVPDHAYALVNYVAADSNLYEVYNPWGTNSQGMALGTYNGQEVYGLFWANAAFISQNYTTQSIGSGAALDGTAGQTKNSAYVQAADSITGTPGQNSSGLAINWTLVGTTGQGTTGDVEPTAGF